MRALRHMAAYAAAALLALGLTASPIEAQASDFTDVPDNHWAETSGVIDDAVAEGLFTGYDNGTFGPDDSLTRGQIAVVMWRVAGEPAADAPDFPDVNYDAYYGDAIEWARSEGVINGFPDGRFGPEENVTRDQLATILYNYEDALGGDTSSDADRLTKYPDAADVESWAHDAISWAVEQGIMGGNVTLNGPANTTRAEAAKMVLVFKRGGDERPALLKAHFIDVGQGDAAFIELANGETMLVDAGTAQAGDDVVSYIRSRGYSRIDYVVMTHPDADHIGGMAEVINYFEIGTLYAPACGSTTQTWERLLDTIAAKGLAITTAGAGVTVMDTDALDVRFVGPASIVEGETNENSALTWIDYLGETFYLTGDADAFDILAAAPGQADLLKVSHHGSTTGTSVSLLNRLAPEYAVISVGADNSYGHPAPLVLTMLENAGAQVFRTDQMGDVTAFADGDDVWVVTEKQPAPDPTPEPTPEPDPAPDPDPEPDPQPPAGPDLSVTVYVTRTGSKYHYDWCPTIQRSKNLRAMTAADAKASGYGACKVCNPPA